MTTAPCVNLEKPGVRLGEPSVRLEKPGSRLEESSARIEPPSAHLEQRAALGEFLRSKRQRLNPLDVGMPGGGRRRTPGLRREEVAVLANVGVSWYTRLEQGHDISPSRAVMTSIAEAFRLNSIEREYLFRLSTRNETGNLVVNCHRYANVQRILQNLNELPAVCLDRYMNVFATNSLSVQLFDCEVGRNCIETFFGDDQHEGKYLSRENTALMLVSQFRRNAGKYAGDLKFTEIIDRCLAMSPVFERLWNDHVVSADLTLSLSYAHDEYGTVEFESTTLEVAGENDLNILVYLPQLSDGSDGRWRSILGTLSSSSSSYSSSSPSSPAG